MNFSNQSSSIFLATKSQALYQGELVSCRLGKSLVVYCSWSTDGVVVVVKTAPSAYLKKNTTLANLDSQHLIHKTRKYLNCLKLTNLPE